MKSEFLFSSQNSILNIFEDIQHKNCITNFKDTKSNEFCFKNESNNDGLNKKSNCGSEKSDYSLVNSKVIFSQTILKKSSFDKPLEQSHSEIDSCFSNNSNLKKIPNIIRKHSLKIDSRNNNSHSKSNKIKKKSSMKNIDLSKIVLNSQFNDNDELIPKFVEKKSKSPHLHHKINKNLYKLLSSPKIPYGNVNKMEKINSQLNSSPKNLNTKMNFQEWILKNKQNPNQKLNKNNNLIKEKSFFSNIFNIKNNALNNSAKKSSANTISPHINLANLNKHKRNHDQFCSGNLTLQDIIKSCQRDNVYKINLSNTDKLIFTGQKVKNKQGTFLKLNNIFQTSFDQHKNFKIKPMTPQIHYHKNKKIENNLNSQSNNQSKNLLNSKNSNLKITLQKIYNPINKINLSSSQITENKQKKNPIKIDKKNNKNKKLHQPKKMTMLKCKCNKTQCTRLHCICFSNQKYCNDTCDCSGCFNLEKHQNIMDKVKILTQEINPAAFTSKIIEVNDKKNKKIVKIFDRGCFCKKNECQKNYCECFKLGLPCSSICKCENCSNEKIYLENKKVQQIFKKNPRKKKKFNVKMDESNPIIYEYPV